MTALPVYQTLHPESLKLWERRTGTDLQRAARASLPVKNDTGALPVTARNALKERSAAMREWEQL